MELKEKEIADKYLSEANQEPVTINAAAVLKLCQELDSYGQQYGTASEIYLDYRSLDHDLLTKESTYQKATRLLNDGKAKEAYSIYLSLKGYMDVDNLLLTDKALHAVKVKRERYSVGNTVSFGSYHTGKEKKAIEWIVLDVKDDQVLMISKNVLDQKSYNTEREEPAWETCTLRKWLNNDFINAAFTTAEQASIVTSTVKAKENLRWHTNAGKDTKDKVWLLSDSEVNTYFCDDTARKCQTTDSKNSWWWLRSHGSNDRCAASVRSDGSLHRKGNHVYNTNGVRPALVINLWNLESLNPDSSSTPSGVICAPEGA
ncbi:MAG: DUF6273 domain-containing protein [Lachnospiraceae bacterium]|nr:DUF6273 domain-containing protein [Lachnospiraceae bacterium]